MLENTLNPVPNKIALSFGEQNLKFCMRKLEILFPKTSSFVLQNFYATFRNFKLFYI